MLWGPLHKAKQNGNNFLLRAAMPVPMSNWNSEKEITNWEGGTMELLNSEEWVGVAHVK
jgi:hypothetical protein